MSVPRGLSEQEAALWARLAATVEPLHGRRRVAPVPTEAPSAQLTAIRPASVLANTSSVPQPRPATTRQLGDRHGLDSGWERRLAKGMTVPDYTLDLHGASLDAAHARLDHGLVQARAMGARIVLLITGKPRGASSADRGQQRGAIRAKVLDWLAAGPHGPDIVAIRTAHRRHGGDGALYLILRRKRG